jgi:3'-phosphoadenosine 5'-phosphosulfate (PAPS) 3'-phosphatase
MTYNKGESQGQVQDTTTISISKLLSTCVDACSRGCEVIRFVNHKRQEKQQQQQQQQQQQVETTEKESNDFNVVYKVADDPRSALTEADLASQRVILYCIRHVWGDGLNIIGEEDESDDSNDSNANNTSTSNGNDNGDQDSDEDLFKKYNIHLPNSTESPIQSDLCQLKNSNDGDIMLSLSDITLYIDPMDGTREFVEQRLHNVQCLIGITWKGRPIGGVIGLPFLWNEGSSGSRGVHVVCGLNWNDSSFVKTICMNKNKNETTPEIDENIWLSLGKNSSESESNNSSILNVFTGDSQRLHKKHALRNLEDWTSSPASDEKTDGTILDICIAGGCGNKILRTAASGLGSNNGNAISIIPPGTCSWDTAAPTAILFAALSEHGHGKVGKVTDMFGGELIYNSCGKKVTNDLGALVSIGPRAGLYHNKLCDSFRRDEIVLNSLLKHYWIDSSSGSSSDDDADVRMKLQIAQKEPQAVDFVRNEKGYVMTCTELKSILSEQVTASCDDLELIGYSIPEKDVVRSDKRESQGGNKDNQRVDKCILHFFWKEESKNNENGSNKTSASKVPESVVYEKVYITNLIIK